MRKASLVAGVIFAVALASAARAEPADEALAAYHRKDYATALRIWKPLAEQGNARAQASLAAMYEGGQGIPRDYAAALELNKKAAAQGDALGQASLGEMYANGKGVRRDYDAAMGWYRLAAEQGDAQAEFDLGLMYETGQGIARDVPDAIRWYRKAVAQGNADALTRLNHWVNQGDLKRGIAAAAKGDRVAAYRVAMLYGNAFDEEEELAWFRKAAEMGEPESQRRLGFMLRRGPKGLRDPVEAAKWTLKAAEGGNLAAWGDLSSIYLTAEGVPRDLVQAYKWKVLWLRSFPVRRSWNASVQQKDDELKAQMTPDQVAEAERLVRDWTVQPVKPPNPY